MDEQEMMDLQPEESFEDELDFLKDHAKTDDSVLQEQARIQHYRGKYTSRKHAAEEPVKPQVGFFLYLRDLVKLLAVIVITFTLVFRIVVVSGTSMNNTLYDGDYLLLLSDVFYRDPKQGDIIVASKSTFDGGDPIVKRVIATEGQWVDIDFEAGIVYVGDSPDTMVALEEPYTKTLTTRSEGVEFPLQVSEGCLFVLGDNRGNSKDSRDPEIGLIDEREILGKVIILFLPGTNYGKEELDFGRIGVVK